MRARSAGLDYPAIVDHHDHEALVAFDVAGASGLQWHAGSPHPVLTYASDIEPQAALEGEAS